VKTNGRRRLTFKQAEPTAGALDPAGSRARPCPPDAKRRRLRSKQTVPCHVGPSNHNALICHVRQGTPDPVVIQPDTRVAATAVSSPTGLGRHDATEVAVIQPVEVEALSSYSASISHDRQGACDTVARLPITRGYDQCCEASEGTLGGLVTRLGSDHVIEGGLDGPCPHCQIQDSVAIASPFKKDKIPCESRHHWQRVNWPVEAKRD